MTTAPPSPTLVRSANIDQRCWMPFVALVHAYNYQAYAVYSATHPAFYLVSCLGSEKSRSLESANDSKTSEQIILYKIHTNREFEMP